MYYLPFFSVETWILLITFICLFVMYGNWTYGTFKKLGVPGPKPFMFIGSVCRLNPVYYVDDKACAQKYGRVWGTYELRKPMLVVMDPDMLKTILVKECFSYFTNRRNLRLNGDLYDSVSIAENDKWRQIRNILSPSFTSGRIKEMFSLMKHHSRKLTASMQSKAQNNEVITVKDFFGAYSMDAIASCVFSVDMDSISSSSNPMITHASKLFRLSIPLFMFQGCFPIFIPLLELLGVSLFCKTSTDFFKTLLEKVRVERNRTSHKLGRVINHKATCDIIHPLSESIQVGQSGPVECGALDNRTVHSESATNLPNVQFVPECECQVYGSTQSCATAEHNYKLRKWKTLPQEMTGWFKCHKHEPTSPQTCTQRRMEYNDQENNDVTEGNFRDILQNMINSQTASEPKKDKQYNGLTDHEIFSQATMFVFAGYETSAVTLVFLAYSLARNPEVMKCLQEEIDSTFPNKGAVHFEALMQMEYLDSVVNECLRLYPPIGRLDRVAKETVEINGIKIPKNMTVVVPVYALHHDPELWPEPEEFKPDRFSKQNKQSINPYTYLPFGMGPRNCLGMRFALTMVKLALVEVLQNYSFSICEETEIPLRMDPQGLVGPLNPIKLKLETRLMTSGKEDKSN